MIDHIREYREAYGREYTLYAEFGIGNHQDHERPEKDEMIDAEGFCKTRFWAKA